MKRSHHIRVAVAALSLVLVMGTGGTLFSEEQQGAEGKEPVIFLSLSDLFEDDERPPVKFHHQLHVEAAGEKGCGACHPANKDGTLDYAYPQVSGKRTKESLMRAYHDACIGCHKEPVGDGKKSGPVTCGECHIWENEEEAKKQVSFPDGGFDYVLHDVHVAVSDCESCHHTGDLTSCRDCHGEADSDEASSYRSAAHASCIACHLEYDIASSCTVCHKEKKRSAKELASISRPQIGQPKEVLISCENATYPGVPFHHEGHEGLTSSCRVCHHDTMQGCDSCHKPKGKRVPLAAAYHEPSAEQSCVGCHNTKKSEALCAGCHHLMETTLSKESCLVCHSGPRAEGAEDRLLKDPAALLPDGISEIIEIDVLEKEYMPAKFPHSAHIKGLTDLSNKDALARHFHANPLTVCMGCHHYSPLKEKSAVPACITCHTPKAEPKGNVPTLLSAYHRQCLGCHKEMGTQPTDCTGCHLEKASP